jgi:hypothetical protein
VRLKAESEATMQASAVNGGEIVATGGSSGMRGAHAGGQQGRGIGLEKGEDDVWSSS